MNIVSRAITAIEFNCLVKDISVDSDGKADYNGICVLNNTMFNTSPDSFSHVQLDKLYALMGFNLKLTGSKYDKYWRIRNAASSSLRAYKLSGKY